MKYIVKYKKLSKDSIPPYKLHPTDAGFDLSVASVNEGETTIKYGCGLAFDFSTVGFAMLVPRSSICKRGLLLSNSPGIIDADYRGEVSGVFYSINGRCDIYRAGERFAQLIFPLVKIGDEIEFVEADELGETERGENGYGSTGK